MASLTSQRCKYTINICVNVRPRVQGTSFRNAGFLLGVPGLRRFQVCGATCGGLGFLGEVSLATITTGVVSDSSLAQSF